MQQPLKNRLDWDDIPEPVRRWDGSPAPLVRCHAATQWKDRWDRCVGFSRCRNPRRPEARYCWTHGGPKLHEGNPRRRLNGITGYHPLAASLAKAIRMLKADLWKGSGI